MNKAYRVIHLYGTQLDVYKSGSHIASALTQLPTITAHEQPARPNGDWVSTVLVEKPAPSRKV